MRGNATPLQASTSVSNLTSAIQRVPCGFRTRAASCRKEG